MKTSKRILNLLFLIVLMSVVFFVPGFSQAVDSVSTSPEIVDTFFGIAIPSAVKTIIISLLVLLPSIQFILKRVPTDGSVKITGVVGKILDFLTFFQKDKIKK